MAAAEAAGLPMKTGLLMTEGEAEASAVWELWRSGGASAFTRGWSFDAITTAARGGLGIAKDLVTRPGFGVDLGAYVTQDYEGLFEGRFDPKFGVGLSMRF